MPKTTIGKFELGEELGKGPLGKVYAAVDTETGEEVVLRGFARPKNADETHWNESIKRFTDELTKAQKLDHPNIAKVIEFGEIDGLYYVATENFRGRNLRQLLDEKHTLDPDEAAAIVKQICLALDYAASQSAVHEDLTPYNVMLLEDGTVKLINYGLGHIRKKLGSPYMSPEQLQGQPLTQRSDLHTLGVLWFGMLMGRVPFRGDTVEELCQQILNHRPPPATAEAPHVQGIIAKLLEKDPEKRYETGVHVLNDLVSGIIPAGYEQTVVKPPAVTVAWNVQDYQELPSLGDYKLEDSDVREIRSQMALKKEVRQMERGDVVKRVALAVAAALCLGFLADGCRQVGRYARLQVVSTAGSVETSTLTLRQWHPLNTGDLVSSTDGIRTGAAGSVTLQTFNGTRVKLGADTEATFNVAGRDLKSKASTVDLALQEGELWASVKPNGANLPPFQAECGGTVVKVKGTVLGLKKADASGAVNVQCLKGAVTAGTGGDEVSVDAGKMADLFRGELTGDLEDLSDEAKELLAKADEEMSAETLMQTLRWALTKLEEKTIVGPVASVASSVGAIGGKSKADSSAIITAHGSMMALTRALELSTEYPQKVNLKTLEGIDLGKEGRERILAQFYQNRLESYQVLADGYEITARCNDSAHSLIRAKNGKVEVVDDNGGKGKGKGD